MRTRYDAEVDAAYIEFTDEVLEPGRDCMALTDPLVERGAIVVLDWKDGKIVGLEVLGASSLLPEDLLAKASRPGEPDQLA